MNKTREDRVRITIDVLIDNWPWYNDKEISDISGLKIPDIRKIRKELGYVRPKIKPVKDSGTYYHQLKMYYLDNTDKTEDRIHLRRHEDRRKKTEKPALPNNPKKLFFLEFPIEDRAQGGSSTKSMGQKPK